MRRIGAGDRVFYRHVRPAASRNSCSTASVARHTLYVLTEALPPPLSDLPEERAARAVAADAHAMDCFRGAGQPGRHPDNARRWCAQAGALMRAADSALRSLRLMRAARAMANSVSAAPEAVQAEQPVAPVPTETPSCDIAAEADQYALAYPKRAALIRRLRRLPHRLDWGPPSPELVRAIVTGIGRH